MSPTVPSISQADLTAKPYIPAAEGVITRFLKAHERLIIVLSIVAALWVAYGKYADILSLRANQKYQTDKAALVLQQQATAAVQKQVAADEAQYADLVQKFEKQNSQLETLILQRDAAAKQQQTVDKSLDVTQSAARLTTQTGAQAGEVTAYGNTVVLDLPVTHTIVADLDKLMDVQADLTDTKTELTNQIQLTQASQTNVIGEQKVNAGLTTELIDETKACNAQVSAVKASARKSKRNWFLRGLAIGGSIAIYVLK